MFIRWKRRSLSDDGYRSDVCCPHEGDGRETLIPVVISVRRIAGFGPRQTVLWRPAFGIRSCCAADRTDPIARALWWAEVRSRCAMLRDGTDSNRFRAEILAGLTELLRTLTAEVPPPTDLETAIAWAWNDLCDAEFPGLDAYGVHRARLFAARRLARSRDPRERESQKTRRPPPRRDRIRVPEELGVLGLSWPCTKVEITRAYRAGAFTRHPDRGGKTEDFIAWTDAYDEVLKFFRKHGGPSNRSS
jgi:hypothetical protein